MEELFLWSRIVFYFGYYVILFIFSIIHRKDIYLAACGGNGVPQPNELTKLFCVYIFAIYCNEVIFRGIPFDVNVGLILMGGIGVANLGKFRMEELSYKKKSDKPEEK